jgi:hypothetical protein
MPIVTLSHEIGAGGRDGGVTMRPRETRSHNGVRIDDRPPGHTLISPTVSRKPGAGTP